LTPRLFAPHLCRRNRRCTTFDKWILTGWSWVARDLTKHNEYGIRTGALSSRVLVRMGGGTRTPDLT